MDIESLLKAAVPTIGNERISAKVVDREGHAKDESFHPQRLPNLVIWPVNTNEISRILQLATQHGIPVTAWGGGSSLEGNPIPVRGGIVLDMTLMNAVLEVMPEDFQARVQPGIIADDLNKHLRRYGLFFPAVTGSSNIATVGGMVANNAGGMYSVKYGVVRDYVMQLEVVLANGEIMSLGSRSIKTVAGYDLVSLFVGSEGTLGIITEATLLLRGLPPSTRTIMATFRDVQEAGNAALDILRSGIEPAALELMDADFVRLTNQAKNLGWSELPTLLIELHSTQESIMAETLEINELCHDNNAISYQTTSTVEAQNRLWEGRRGLRLAVRSILPDIGIIPGDIGVPLSKIPQLIERAQEVGAEFGVRTVTFGHAGDGNFHIWMLYHLKDEDSRKRAHRVNEKLIRYAIEVGGTSTAEHGIGIGKREFLPLEHPSSMKLMLEIKRLLDPYGILNPGKIFPD